MFCSSLSLNVVLCLCAWSLPAVFVSLRRIFVCVRSVFVCFRQLSVCLRNPLCVIAPHFRVCALRLCVFRPIVYVFAQPSVCHCVAFLCVIAQRFCACTLCLCLFPLSFCGLAPPSVYSRFSLLGFSPRSLSSPASGCVFVYARALVCGFFFSCGPTFSSK